MGEKVCKTCGSGDLARNGARTRNQCQPCWNAYQRERYHANREGSLATRRALYQKHAEKRRAESAARKARNREHYSLLEWFRRKGIPASEIPAEDFAALVEMKKALKASKRAAKGAATA